MGNYDYDLHAFFIPMVMNDINQTSSQDEKSFFGTSFFLGLLGFIVYFSKDSFNGRSLAKRITKLQAVENKTGEVASPLRCFIRNVFCVIWPIEVIVTLINPTRRIGERVAGTRIIYYDPALIEQGLGIAELTGIHRLFRYSSSVRAENSLMNFCTYSV